MVKHVLVRMFSIDHARTISLFSTRPGRFVPTKSSRSVPKHPGDSPFYSSSEQNDQNHKHNISFLLLTRKRLWMGVGVVGIILGGYYYSHLENVPITGRCRFMVVDRNQEKSLGQMTYESMMLEYGPYVLSQYHPTTIYVARVARRLLESAVATWPELFRFADNSQLALSDFQVHVVDLPIINAVVLPDGHIFVFSGILPIARDETGLATVLGHEISHKLLRHHAERISLYAVLFYFGLIDAIVRLLNDILLSLGVILPNSRKTEVEADRVGVLLMGAACYAPTEAVAFWKRMESASQSSKSSNSPPVPFFSTHPSHGQRIRQLNIFIEEAERLRERSGCDSFWKRYNIL